jgi:methionyl aminopeptidase
MSITLKTEQQISYMRQAGKIVAEALQVAKQVIRPGITTNEINDIVEKHILSRGATPSFKGYYDFPAAICTSVNNEVVHGIPGSVILKDGDIISVDVGAYINGYHGDAADTFEVGNVSDEAKKLIEVTKQSFYEGLKYARQGYRLYDISSEIQKYNESHGFSVVRDYVGHGIGQKMHEEPQIPNYGKPGHGPRLMPGMTLAIEPMINMGDYHVKVLQNDWTVVTTDGSLSAHYENTILITEQDPEILTAL